MNESVRPESVGDEVSDPANELLQLRGLGPKRVQVLRALGVQTVADLQAAAQEQRLRCVPGFSAALEQNILRAVAAHAACDPRRRGAVLRDGVRTRRPLPTDRTLRCWDAHRQAADAASPTGWMRSIWRSAPA